MNRFHRKIYQPNNFICDIRKMNKVFYPIYNTENILSGYIVTIVLKKISEDYFLQEFNINRVKRVGNYGEYSRQTSLIIKNNLKEDEKLDIVNLYSDF